MLSCNSCGQWGTKSNTDSYTSDSVSESSSLAPEEAWHLSAPLSREYNPPYIPASMSKIALKTPVTYEETVDGVTFRVNFFTETHRLGSLIQVRLSVTNGTERDITYIGYTDGNGLFNKDGDLLTIYEAVLDPNSGVGSDTCMTYYVTFPQGETLQFEYVYTTDPDYFTTDGSYEFFFGIREEVAGEAIGIRIPVEVVGGT